MVAFLSGGFNTAANLANQRAGTDNGAPLIDSLGNTFLEGINTITNVGLTGLQSYSSFREYLDTVNKTKQQKNTPPREALPANKVNSVADFMSEPNRKMIAYAALGAAALLGVFYLARG